MKIFNKTPKNPEPRRFVTQEQIDSARKLMLEYEKLRPSRIIQRIPEERSGIFAKTVKKIIKYFGK